MLKPISCLNNQCSHISYDNQKVCYWIYPGYSVLKVCSTQLSRVSAAPFPLQGTAGSDRLDPPYGRQSDPAINELPATLTSACTSSHWTCAAAGWEELSGGVPPSLSLFPPFLPLLLFFFFSSPPLESAVHLTPQIAYDSRAISSPGFELNWSEQYHLCLLKGRSGSRCCSAERNQEEREGWWMVDGGWGEHGGQKSCYLQPSKPQFHMQSAQLAPLWGGLSCSLLFIPHLALSPGELLPLSARTLYLPGSCHLFFPPSSLFRHPSLSHFLLLSLFQRAVPEDSREMNVVSL